MLINIQFLRFAAAMVVVLYHTSSHVRSSGVDQGAFFALSEATGFAGVDVFFVISGFIMAHTAHDEAGSSAGWSFFRRRIARIYSGYWPFYLLAIALFAWVNPVQLQNADLARSAILWPANHLLIAVAWTLIFEMFFYLLFSGVIMLTRQRRDQVLLFLFVAMLAWSVYSQFVRHAFDPGQLETMSLAEYYMLSPYITEFLGGALIAIWLRSHPRGSGAVWLAAGLGLFLLGGWINNVGFDGQIEQGYYVFYRVLVFGSASAMMLAGLVRLEQDGRQTPVRFSLRAGGASYAIYLSHTLILTVTQKLGLNEFAGSQGAASRLIIYLGLAALILVASVLHYRWLERPLHRRFKTILKLR